MWLLKLPDISLYQMDLESRHFGWVSCIIPERNTPILRLELKGPDNSLRLRQIKVLGDIDGSTLVVGKQESPLVMQQKNCEVETLRVFRLLTSQVSDDAEALLQCFLGCFWWAKWQDESLKADLWRQRLRSNNWLCLQVFGRLISDEVPAVEGAEEKKEVSDSGHEGDIDLKEHMVGILFSRSKLTHLQKQVRDSITSWLILRKNIWGWLTRQKQVYVFV